LALPLRRGRAADSYSVPSATLEELESNLYVYVSPLRSDGNESQCHAEVWYFWDAQTRSVVLATGSETWKAKAVERGLDRARLWVGDYRPQKGPEGPFRERPGFLARAVRERDRAIFDRLLEGFAGRYPAEWDKWKPRFEKGYSDGSRVVIRYEPLGD
jgi:hypothetical protein